MCRGRCTPPNIGATLTCLRNGPNLGEARAVLVAGSDVSGITARPLLPRALQLVPEEIGGLGPLYRIRAFSAHIFSIAHFSRTGSERDSHQVLLNWCWGLSVNGE
jgi:hypothetical protein